MIFAKETVETIGEWIVEHVAAILRAMDIGAPAARAIWTMRVMKIDDRTFHVEEMDRPTGKPSVISGLDATSRLIGNFALTSAFMVDQIPELLDSVKLLASRIGSGAGWNPDAKPHVGGRLPKNETRHDEMAQNGTLAESDKAHLLRKLRRVEKAAIEGTVSRDALKKAIDDLEDRIENKYSMDDYDRLLGAVEILSNVFKV